ncbi:Transcriptional regulator [uncultured Alphaproteobacteria bacterium]|uniref:Transcriptional regulator n=1 Tax=uncultured Alphaproteobacteria bacterium TaxID=91750 RepID=A0A212KLL1_9PROT|nr:Transcriptional regulator [uncultured Alphaproteobacteria bacterium]
MDAEDTSKDIANLLEKVQVKLPSDLIIEQISHLISSGALKPGQRLPSERVLEERFGVGRAHVRQALHRLELSGIVRTLPQSGTVVEKIGVQTIEWLIRNILGKEELTTEMLTEVRGLLEVSSARLAAERASPKQLAELRQAYDQLVTKTHAGDDPMETDFLFHMRLADATNNVLLRSLINLMRPDVMRFAQEHRTAKDGRPKEALVEHLAILEAVETRRPDDAAAAMRHHIRMSREQYQDR